MAAPGKVTGRVCTRQQASPPGAASQGSMKQAGPTSSSAAEEVMPGEARDQAPDSEDQACPTPSLFPSSSQGWNSSPQAFWRLHLAWDQGQPTPPAFQGSQGSAELGGAGEECGRTAGHGPQPKPPSRERLMLMLHVERLQQLIHSEAQRPAPHACWGLENGQLAGSK